MRQLQPLCSEIAEISDDDEYNQAIRFVQDAWMNARMRKRVKVTVDTGADGVESGREDADVRMTDDGDPKPDEDPDDINMEPTQPSAGKKQVFSGFSFALTFSCA
jgi:hypothetical protein